MHLKGCSFALKWLFIWFVSCSLFLLCGFKFGTTFFYRSIQLQPSPYIIIIIYLFIFNVFSSSQDFQFHSISIKASGTIILTEYCGAGECPLPNLFRNCCKLGPLDCQIKNAIKLTTTTISHKKSRKRNTLNSIEYPLGELWNCYQKKFKEIDCQIKVMPFGTSRPCHITDQQIANVWRLDGPDAVSYTHLTLPTNREV